MRLSVAMRALIVPTYDEKPSNTRYLHAPSGFSDAPNYLTAVVLFGGLVGLAGCGGGSGGTSASPAAAASPTSSPGPAPAPAPGSSNPIVLTAHYAMMAGAASTMT